MKIYTLELDNGEIALTKNKTFDYQFDGPAWYRHNGDVFEFNIKINRHEDHAGLYFSFGIFKLFMIHISLHDNRHWNYDENRWMYHGEIIKED
jgi:hypothetical protein